MTKIEWTDETWNPVTGCTKVSAGCKNCYAERMSKRLAGRFGYPKDDPFRVTLHEDRLDAPFRWRKPRRVFVCSMGDLFHEDVSDDFIWRVLFPVYVLGVKSQHTWQILTKRPARMMEYINSKKSIPDNVWLGVSVEDQATADERIPLLLKTHAAVRFVSYEPALGPVDCGPTWYEGGKVFAPLGEERFIDCGGCRGAPVAPIYPGGQQPYCPEHEAGGIDWVICGGETGPGARPMNPDWARSLRDQCAAAGVPFFFKSMGAGKPTPDDLLIRQFPGGEA